MLKELLKHFGQTYSKELNIDLKSKKPQELFKWFLASLLFGARISETCAKRTYKALEKYKLLSPQKIEKTSWDFLVSHIMAEGGYVRYDGKTSDELLRISSEIIDWYDGDLNKLHQKAKNSQHLEQLLQEFYSVGPITCNIFLRELRGIWKKANPDFSPYVKLAAEKLGIRDIKKYWQKNKIKGFDFTNFEAALLRLGKNFCHRKKCKVCSLKKYCKHPFYK